VSMELLLHSAWTHSAIESQIEQALVHFPRCSRQLEARWPNNALSCSNQDWSCDFCQYRESSKGHWCGNIAKAQQ
jgi:hypothetical protein